MTDDKKVPYLTTQGEEWAPVNHMNRIKPLRLGRKSIAEQAAEMGKEVPLYYSVGELLKLGYDVDPDWAVGWILIECKESPTGYALAKPSTEYARIVTWVLMAK